MRLVSVVAVSWLFVLPSCSAEPPPGSGDAGTTTSMATGDAGAITGAEVRPLGSAQDGVATFYAATGAGNCSFDPSPADLRVAAMNDPQWDNSAVCGLCVRVEGPRGVVTVRIVDRCPECAAGALDLSREAFAEIADLAAGRVDVRWQPVTCAVQGPVSYRFKEGSSQWWTGLQVRNTRVPVRSLEVQQGASWVSVPRESYNFFVAPAGLGTGPYTLRVTGSDGQHFIESGVPLRESGDVPGAQQFE